ncbi:MAG: response regulator [Nitrospinaceae bacterium]|nr:response regulator [Nitrospinaceae bacterium]
MTEKKLDAEVLASEPDIQEKIFHLVKLSEKKTVTAKELLATKELTGLRKQLGLTSKKYGFVGFVIFNKAGLQIGALLDHAVGSDALKDRSNFFKRSLQGKTVVSQPFKAEIGLPDVNGVMHKNWPTMFVSTPVKNQAGDIKAVLAFRIRPEIEFSELFYGNRFGKSGETYAFSLEGMMLTNSRFNQSLRRWKLIPQSPSSLSILNVQVRDPQINITEGIKPSLPQKDWPLTQMATSAILGETKVQTQPYNDYRGIPVVGAWAWIPEFDLGIASEVDASEALQPLHSLKTSFYILFGFLSLASFMGILFRSKQVNAEEVQYQKEQKTLDEKLKNQIILDNVVDAIITIDEQGAILSFNQGARNLFQYELDQVEGRNVKMLMPDPYHSEHDDYLQRYLTTQSPHIIGIGREVIGLKKDGSEFQMDLAVSQVNLHDRVIFTGIIRDISQRKEFEGALIEAKKMAEDASQSKGDFLANMSHEIRTPMNGIIGLTHLAMKTELTPVQHDYLKKIDSSSQNLLTIINDILDVSKIEAGKLDIEETEFNLDKVLEGVSDVLHTKIMEKGLEFNFNLAPEVPRNLLGDPVRLSQILTNLTSNAVKFTEKGTITISIKVLQQTQDILKLEFSVQDSGIGLSELQISKLFKPFNQADSSTTRKFGGTGLGLTIVKKLILLMNGDIRIESQLGEGSDFIFDIELKPSLKKEVPLPIEKDSPKLRILVIDDSPFMRDILVAMLKTLKFETDVAPLYSTGLEMLKTTDRPYDLVIIDNKLPDATGAKVCPEIRSIYPDKDTKTILISGFSEEDILKEIDTAEFDGFLHKPITLSSLLNMIQHVLGFQTSKEKIVIQSQEPEVQNLDSIRGARILLVEDNPINQQIGVEILQGAGLTVSLAENGQDAVEAVKQNEFDTVLMDIQMPIMDGYRATREIRALAQFKDLPIIAMTANASAADRKKAFDCGMNGHIAKPVNPNKLIETLVETISLGVTVSATKQENPNTKTSELKPIPGLDLVDGLHRVGFNEDLYKSLLIQFASSKARVLEKLDEAVQREDLKKAGELLHSLKGVAGNIGAKDLASKATQLENKLKKAEVDSEYNALLLSAKQSLRLTLEGIALLEQKHSSPEIKITQPLPDYDKLSPFIKVLEDYISDNNMQARDYLESIEETFKETPIKDFLSPVKKHLNQFNFSQATISLAEISNELKK